MPGLGTIVNVAGIILGGLLGLAFGRYLSEQLQKTLMTVNGICSMFIGVGGVMANMLIIENGRLQTQGSMMMIVSLVAGAVIGEFLRIEDRLESFGEWLKLKTGNGDDAFFINAFVTASLTVCIGAMAVVGSIQDGIMADHSTLFAKTALDTVIIMIMATSLGKGAIFSAVSVGVFQGVITILAGFLAPFMTEDALSNISYVGSVMIFCVGLNLAFGKRVRVGNLLPGLLIAVLFSLFTL